jgi:hypothetical protein
MSEQEPTRAELIEARQKIMHQLRLLRTPAHSKAWDRPTVLKLVGMVKDLDACLAEMESESGNA